MTTREQLIKALRIKSTMIAMGEPTDWAGLISVLKQAADMLEADGVPVAWLNIEKLSKHGMAYATSFKGNGQQIPLYTAPQPAIQAEHSDIDPRWASIDYEAVNAELRDYREQVSRLRAALDAATPITVNADRYVEPTLTAERVPLTDERILHIRRFQLPMSAGDVDFARAIKHAHGIGEDK